VSLAAFARFERSLADDRVTHDGQFAVENINFDLAEGVSLDQAVRAIDRAMAAIGLPGEIQGSLGGSGQQFQQAQQSQHGNRTGLFGRIAQAHQQIAHHQVEKGQQIAMHMGQLGFKMGATGRSGNPGVFAGGKVTQIDQQKAIRHKASHGQETQSHIGMARGTEVFF